MHWGFMIQIAGGILLAIAAIYGIWFLLLAVNGILLVFGAQKTEPDPEPVKEPLGVRIRHTVISSPSPYLHS